MSEITTDEVGQSSRWWRIVKRVFLIVFAIVVVLAIIVLAVANSKDGAVSVLQSIVYRQRGEPPNSFKPLSPPAEVARADGIRVKSNVAYGAQYPNSFADIWYAPGAAPGKRPTVIFLHGGGFFMGGKSWGDPFANDGKGEAMSGTIERLAAAGFNVVNMDYALSPAYRYPTPLIQLNQAIAFLQKNADRLGLDMTRLFLMGGSAGAQMSAQYGAMLADPAYAAAVGIRPAIARSDVRGLVLFSPPLKVSGFGWRFNAMLWSYLNTKDLKNSAQARQLDLVPKVTPNYPATYITDGNQPDTFPEHAKALNRALDANGVDHVFTYFEPTEAKLDHGYTGRLDTRWGRENLERAIAFIQVRSEQDRPENRVPSRRQ